MSNNALKPQQYLDSLAKPKAALGTLEHWAKTLCHAQKTLKPNVDSVTTVVFCADHGIKKDNFDVSPFPQSVTQAVFRALAEGLSATATLSRSVGAHLTVVDCGIDGNVLDVPSDNQTNLNRHVTVVHKKVAMGTSSIIAGPAMTELQVTEALAIGASTVDLEVTDRQATVFAIGEAGIGNTTIAAALLSALTGATPKDCCGRGTGLNEEGLKYKINMVRKACKLHQPHVTSIDDESKRARETLKCLGGFEIAAMVGAYLRAPQVGVVAIVDGFISAVAALCAIKMEPKCRPYLIFSTALEEEPKASVGGQILSTALGNPRPALSMNLCLGEASAATLVLPILRAAAEIVLSMGTLDEVMKLVPQL